MITPSDLHVERHHGGVPTIDPESYELLIHGMVERPKKFTLRDLRRYPAVSRICFLECSGNLWATATEDAGPQDICGLTSQSEWTGVMLSTLFREVGVDPEATWFVAEGGDAAVMTRSIPMEKAWDGAMIAYGQNGEALRPENGYPARLLNPGSEGNSSVKWIRLIEVADRPFMSREETSKYTEPIRGGKARQFSFVMEARSIITFPAYPNTVHKGWSRSAAWRGADAAVSAGPTSVSTAARRGSPRGWRSQSYRERGAPAAGRIAEIRLRPGKFVRVGKSTTDRKNGPKEKTTR